MDEELTVGAARYGEGEVAGFDPGRGTVRVWFAGAGLKALPYPCAELAAVPFAEGERSIGR